MKIDRHGKAAILSPQEIQLLFSKGLVTIRDRALFGCMLFTGCRIKEACTLRTKDVYDLSGSVRPKLIIRKGNTKGKLATRTIPIIQDLRAILASYYSHSGEIYLFPGRFKETHFQPDSADKVLRKACDRVGLQGISTHSFRRTALTMMSDNLNPLRVIQEVSGHRNLSQLQAYIEVRDDQVLGAVSSLSMLTPVSAVNPENVHIPDSSLSTPHNSPSPPNTPKGT